MKKILIPTDFTVESLQLIEYGILNYPNTKLDVVLVHGHRMPENKWGVINFSCKRQISNLTKENFIEAKNNFINEHKSEINSIELDLFTGINSVAFKNFCKQHQVEDAIIPKDQFLIFAHKNSFDPTFFMKRNIKNVVEVHLENPNREISRKKFSISNLLNL
ncbi:hypothetical protein [Aquimarina muelleri]|uniref:Uncharacterized protein n=1 Tax=Aquimarina muelleri TaxID=279356 RepID=A0A918N2W8_9FLAO|nr:hypothetical protein [Aquimarina muelleri]MCX2763962.1 hypothetical protein [Aquimarina muelleri]GGX22235.1 hypothetical protein GCM10007384_24300 [Aquimarina muelleri]